MRVGDRYSGRVEVQPVNHTEGEYVAEIRMMEFREGASNSEARKYLDEEEARDLASALEDAAEQ